MWHIHPKHWALMSLAPSKPHLIVMSFLMPWQLTLGVGTGSPWSITLEWRARPSLLNEPRPTQVDVYAENPDSVDSV